MINFNIKLILISSFLVVVFGFTAKYFYNIYNQKVKEYIELENSFNTAVKEYENQLIIKEEELNFTKELSSKKESVIKQSQKIQIEKEKRGAINEISDDFVIVHF